MKSLKEYADEMRTMASMLNEAADSLGSYHDEQLRGVMAAMGLSLPAHATEAANGAPAVPVAAPLRVPPVAAAAAPGQPPEVGLTQKVRRDYADLPPAMRTLDSRLFLARKYSLTETQISDLVHGPVQNGALTRK